MSTEQLTLSWLREQGAGKIGLLRWLRNGMGGAFIVQNNEQWNGPYYAPLILDTLQKQHRGGWWSWLNQRVAEIEAEGGGDGFDPRELRVGDEYAVEGRLFHYRVLYVNPTGILRYCTSGDLAPHWTPIDGAHFHEETTVHVTRDDVQIYPKPEPKFKVGALVDTTDFSRVPACWPATVLGAKWRDGRYWYRLAYAQTGVECGPIWDEPCLFLAPAPEPEPSIKDEVRRVINLHAVGSLATQALFAEFDTTRKVRK